MSLPTMAMNEPNANADQPSNNSSSATVAPRNRALRSHVMADVSPDLSTYPLAAYCFMTGYIDVVSFSAIFVWAGFQTGNTSQLAIALARLFMSPSAAGLPAGTPRDTSFHLADKMALCSVLTFLAGAFIGRIGDRMGAKSRAWLCLGTLIQALFTMAAAIAIGLSHQGGKHTSIANNRDDPAWTDAAAYICLGFISASLGLQGIMGKRVNTQFATTIVLTTVWCELMADPKLFKFRHMVKTRDHKLVGIAALFIGAFVGRAILQAIGAAGTLGIGAGFRLIIALVWLVTPGVPPKEPAKESAAGEKQGA